MDPQTAIAEQITELARQLNVRMKQAAEIGLHFPVGPAGEFVWEGTQEKVGT